MSTTETEILEQLYRRYYSAAYLYCLSLCGDGHTAQDLVSDAFVKAYLSLPEEVPSFRYWLFRVCKNLWIDHCRKAQHQTGPEALDFIPALSRESYRSRSCCTRFSPTSLTPRLRWI